MVRTRILGGLILATLPLLSTAARAQSSYSMLRNGDHPVVTVPVAVNESVRSPLPTTIDIPLNADGSAAASGTPGRAVVSVPADSSCCGGLSECVKPCEIFHKHQIELQAMSGAAYHAFIGGIPATGARMLFLPQSLRVGIDLNNPNPERVFKGTWSFVAESDTAPIVYGPGSILVGGSLGLRYTASQRCSRCIPYIQASFGAAFSDSYRSLTTNPPVLGQVPTGLTSGTEFLFTGILGTHYLLNSKWSIDAEATLQAITNFGIAPDHKTIYPVGAAVGVTRFLR